MNTLRPNMLNGMLSLEMAASEWFAQMTPTQRREYVKAHPKSKYATNKSGTLSTQAKSLAQTHMKHAMDAKKAGNMKLHGAHMRAAKNYSNAAGHLKAGRTTQANWSLMHGNNRAASAKAMRGNKPAVRNITQKDNVGAGTRKGAAIHKSVTDGRKRPVDTKHRTRSPAGAVTRDRSERPAVRPARTSPGKNRAVPASVRRAARQDTITRKDDGVVSPLPRNKTTKRGTGTDHKIRDKKLNPPASKTTHATPVHHNTGGNTVKKGRGKAANVRAAGDAPSITQPGSSVPKSKNARKPKDAWTAPAGGGHADDDWV